MSIKEAIVLLEQQGMKYVRSYLHWNVTANKGERRTYEFQVGQSLIQLESKEVKARAIAVLEERES